MSYLPMVMQLAGTIIQATSSVQEGQAMSGVELANANIASSQAAQTRQAGKYDVARIKREKEKTAGIQKARYAKSGVLITEGSPIEVMADTAAQFQMDIMATEYNTAIEASRYYYEAETRKIQAERYRRAGYTKAAGGTLLSLAKIGSAYGGFVSGTPAIAGQGGYGAGTPAGARNMGTWTRTR